MKGQISKETARKLYEAARQSRALLESLSILVPTYHDAYGLEVHHLLNNVIQATEKELHEEA